MGIDCSKTKIALAQVDPQVFHTFTRTTQKVTRADQLWDLYQDIEHVTFLWKPDVVYVEEPIVGKGVQSSLRVAETYGAVMAAARSNVSQVLTTSIASWKKGTVGSGNAGKSQVTMWLNDTNVSYSEQCDGDQDLIDATCIALYGIKIHRVADSLFGI